MNIVLVSRRSNPPASYFDGKVFTLMSSNFKLNLKSLEMAKHFQLNKGMSEGEINFSNHGEKIHLLFEMNPWKKKNTHRMCMI